MKPVRLITFDLDNTLWDVEQVVGRAEHAMRRWLGEHAPETLDAYQGEGILERRKTLVETRPELRHDLSALRIAVLEQCARETGLGTRQAQRLAEQAFDVFMVGRHDVEYFEGALDTLSILARDYQLAALTNGNAAIERLGLDRFFEFGITAADAGASKPQPHMFEMALRRSGVAAEHAVHIGDHLVDDIAGAAGVGMRTVLVEIKDHRPLHDDAQAGSPDHRVDRLEALPAIIAALAGART